MDDAHLDLLIGRVVKVDEMTTCTTSACGDGMRRRRPSAGGATVVGAGRALVAGSEADFRGVEYSEREVVVRIGALIAGAE